jgi:hypothetical protein
METASPGLGLPAIKIAVCNASLAIIEDIPAAFNSLKIQL